MKKASLGFQVYSGKYMIIQTQKKLRTVIILSVGVFCIYCFSFKTGPHADGHRAAAIDGAKERA